MADSRVIQLDWTGHFTAWAKNRSLLVDGDGYRENLKEPGCAHRTFEGKALTANVVFAALAAETRHMARKSKRTSPIDRKKVDRLQLFAEEPLLLLETTMVGIL